mgnify:CR=1 FL=1
MKTSGIGGQAVLEGVMMKNQEQYAVAVRTPEGEISVDVHTQKRNSFIKTAQKIPIIRGVVNFVESLVVGMRTLMISASYEEGEEEVNFNENKAAMFGTIALSVVIAIVVFMLIPYGVSLLFERWITSLTVLALIEGVLRVAIFLGYVALISVMEDIRRVFMYHGAEHKCINCIEHGLELTVENVRKSSRLHKRCGTSFLLIVMVISIVIFACIQVPSPWLRLVLRLVLIPVVAGVSYEFIRLAGRSENAVVNVLSKPGLWLQRLTTREPDDSMIEVGIASVEAVFDWEEFLSEYDTQTAR